MSKVAKIISIIFLLIVIAAAVVIKKRITQLRPSPTIEDSTTSIIGFNNIGLSVRDLDSMLDFYQNATSFELIERRSIYPSKSTDLLFGKEETAFEVAVLKAPNMLLELTEFKEERDSIYTRTPAYGPGMTHTCYQSAESNSGFDHFVNAGAEPLTRGGQPVALGNYGVTYAYAYDPEGNMVELEQMSGLVTRLMIGKKWADAHPLWMTQVAILTPDLARLTDYYKMIFEMEPYRVGTYGSNLAMDQVVDMDSLSFQAAWFMLDGKGKKLELMQYEQPIATPKTIYNKSPTDLGYTYSFEVLDIQRTYQRLLKKGVEFISAPQELEHYWMVYAFDVDGNIFALRQAINNQYSLVNF